MNKRIVNFVFYFGILSLLMGCKMKNTTDLLEFPISEGDLVFRRGIGIASHFIVTSDRVGLYSHTGIVVRHRDSLLIAHAVPGEHPKGTLEVMKLEPIEQFFNRKQARAGLVLRPNVSEAQRQLAAQTARSLFELGTTFDHNYNLLDTTQMYCTELVWFAYLKAGLDVTQNKRTHVKLAMFNDDFIFPSDIYDNSIFEKIVSFNY